MLTKLTNTDVSLAMQGYLNNAVSFMKKKGYILPSLLILDKGAPLDLVVSHKAILEVATTIDEEDFEEPDENEIYEYGISFKLNQEYDDKYLSEVASKLAKDYSPGAIGAISACLFRDFPEGILPKEMNIQKDSDAIRVIFLSYYMRGESTPNYMVVPYTKREIENPGWGEDAFAISTITSSWNTGMDVADLLMPNPYL
jgi:hypothetical protein